MVAMGREGLMFLEKIEVQNYRSISALSLAPCGDFNVLIGRNSAGKSNILTTIDAFFASIKRRWVNTAPPLGEEIDFFQKNLNNTISIEATFGLLPVERDELFADVSEAGIMGRSNWFGVCQCREHSRRRRRRKGLALGSSESKVKHLIKREISLLIARTGFEGVTTKSSRKIKWQICHLIERRLQNFSPQRGEFSS
jgi:hypothetical protein